MEGNSRVLMGVVTMETSVKVADIPDEIQSEYLPNQNLDRYLYTSLLAGRNTITSTGEGINSNFWRLVSKN
jgi:hypothetical protein